MPKQTPTIQGLAVGGRHDDVAILKGFLERFGYYTKEIKEVSLLTPEPPDIFDLATAMALKGYQRFHGLAQTGALDQGTVFTMSQPRCGVPDINTAI